MSIKYSFSHCVPFAYCHKKCVEHFILLKAFIGGGGGGRRGRRENGNENWKGMEKFTIQKILMFYLKSVKICCYQENESNSKFGKLTITHTSMHTHKRRWWSSHHLVKFNFEFLKDANLIFVMDLQVVVGNIHVVGF